MKKTLYTILASGLLGLNYANAAINFGENKVKTNIRGTDEGAGNAVQTLIANLSIFLGIIAVGFIIYAGYLILAAGGDEEKVKKGKTIIIQSIIGLVVIYLAYSIVSWVISGLFGGTAN